MKFVGVGVTYKVSNGGGYTIITISPIKLEDLWWVQVGVFGYSRGEGVGVFCPEGGVCVKSYLGECYFGSNGAAERTMCREKRQARIEEHDCRKERMQSRQQEEIEDSLHVRSTMIELMSVLL